MSISTLRFGMARSIIAVAIALAAPLVIAAALRADGEKTKTDAKPPQLAKDLIGTWVLAGTPDNDRRTACDRWPPQVLYRQALDHH